MTVKNENLTRNQVRCIKALLEHPRVDDAANDIGVSVSTVYRWLREPVFMAALRSAETEFLSDGIRALIVDMRDNHDVMKDIRDTPRYSPAVRLRAAQSLDNSLLRWREIQTIEDLAERVSALEAKSNDKT